MVDRLLEWRLLCRLSLGAKLSRERERPWLEEGLGGRKGFSFKGGKALSMFC